MARKANKKRAVRRQSQKSKRVKAAGKARLRKLSDTKLRQILAAHRKWLETGGEEGKQADLQRVDLRGKHLWEVDLRAAFLWKANLSGSSWKKANFQLADLRRANLENVSVLDNVVRASTLYRQITCTL